MLQRMEDEHMSEVPFTPPNSPGLVTCPREEWLFVVDKSYTRPMPSGHLDAHSKPIYREKVLIEDLLRHPSSVEAKLTGAEIIAARLYTGPMFSLYNKVLRHPDSYGDLRDRFIYTIHIFSSCILKLSRIHCITKVYRGIKNGILPASFLEPNKYGVRGGVEYGFMSTTTDRLVAFSYAGIAKKAQKDNTSHASIVCEVFFSLYIHKRFLSSHCHCFLCVIRLKKVLLIEEQILLGYHNTQKKTKLSFPHSLRCKLLEGLEFMDKVL